PLRPLPGRTRSPGGRTGARTPARSRAQKARRRRRETGDLATLTRFPPKDYDQTESMSAENGNGGNGADRREHFRAPIELKVEYKKLNTFFADYTKNICKGGTFIKTKKPLDIGTEFLFKLSVPNLGEPLALRGQVKWVMRE